MPFAWADALHLCTVEHELASHFHVFACADERLLLGIADEFLLVALAAAHDEAGTPLVVEFQVVTLDPHAVAGTHVDDTSHHSRLVLRVQIDIGTDLIVSPGGVSHDGVVMPFGCPAEGVVTHHLPHALSLVVRAFGEFEGTDDVREIVGQVAIGRGGLVLLEVIGIGEGERLRGGNVGEGTLLLSARGGERVDSPRLECDFETTATGMDVLLLHK